MDIREEQQQVILEFVFESKETLDSLELTLIRLEGVTDIEKIRETMNLIFRPFHTLKGGAGFLQLDAIGKLTHTTENLLQVFRTDPYKWKQDYIEILMQCSDLLRQMLDQVEIQFHDQGFEDSIQELNTAFEKAYNDLSGQTQDEIKQESESLPSINGKPTQALPDVLKKAAQFIHSLVESKWQALDQEKEYSETLELVQELIRHHNQLVQDSSEEPEELFYLPDIDSVSEGDGKPEKANENDEEAYTVEGDRFTSFVTTTLEHLETIEGVMLVLDKIPDDVNTDEYLHSALRSFHSIKGNAGFLNQNEIENLSHLAENTLSSLKEGQIRLDETSSAVIFKVVDVLRTAINRISNEQTVDQQSLLEVEKQLAELNPEANSNLLGNILVRMGKVKADDINEAVKQQKTPLGDMLIQMGKASKSDIDHALNEQKAAQKQSTATAAAQPSVTKMQDIRVSLEKLDHLFDLVGELIISESMISKHPVMESLESESIKVVSSQLHRNMRSLQEIVMSIRMVPVSTLFRKMVRVVHDASKKLGKKVNLDLVGEKTEVDKTLVELITDPLLHIVRNAMDHGIESPEERSAQGKDPLGSLTLEAKHVGNEVWISVIDNGKGLDKDKILKRAMDKGLITEETSFSSESEIWKLIFEPGFSTADTVTDFSGRGVGLDVVRRNIEKLRGSIDIESQKNEGSHFILKIPLTLSIIDGLLVTVGHSAYALPTAAIRETLQPNTSDIVKTMDGSEMLRLRKRVIPVIRLHRIYGITPHHQELHEGMLLVIDHIDHAFALFVDTVEGQQQIVVKSLPESMMEAPHLSGCTILGDGQVGLILDATSIGKAVIRQKRAL